MPKQKKSKKGAAKLALESQCPSATRPLNDMLNNLTQPSDNALLPLCDTNFKMERPFHDAFKLESVLRRMTMKELFRAAFKCYLDTHGSLADPNREIV